MSVYWPEVALTHAHTRAHTHTHTHTHSRRRIISGVSSVWQTLDMSVYWPEVSHYSCIVSECALKSNQQIPAPHLYLHSWSDSIKTKRKHSLWYLVHCYINNIRTTTSNLTVFCFQTAFSQQQKKSHLNGSRGGFPDLCLVGRTSSFKSVVSIFRKCYRFYNMTLFFISHT